ncbi:MAG TPA: hypothetical protein VN829_00705 [Dongiaceae bacterium]|nr:hypothetical protein [Dongiaceae bacterium]
MKRHEADRLLSELLAGDALSDFRRSSLEEGLALIRRRRRARRAGRWCVLALLPLAFGAGVLLSWPARVRPVSVADSHAARVPGQSAGAGSVRIINDEELMALFAGRPLALVGRPGHQQLLFLDQPAAPPEPGGQSGEH